MKISLFGDLCCNFESQISVDQNLFSNTDLLIGNLEFPLTKSQQKFPKSGPNISGSYHSFQKVINQINVKKQFLSLSNNHIMDYGQAGLNQTVQYLKSYKISFSGTSKDDGNFIKEKIINIKNDKIAIISVCEKQFGISQKNRVGVNYYDSRIYSQIKKAKRYCNFVIISIHASEEMSLWPSPQWQLQLRSYIDAGANVIHGHHSHVPQGYEKYKNGLIFYGLGNFIVNPKYWKEYKNTLWSLGADITIKGDKIQKYDIYPIEITEKENSIFITKQNIKNKITYLKDCNIPLKNHDMLIKIWQEYSVRMYNKCYKNWLFGNDICDNSPFKRIKMALKIIFKKYKKRQSIADQSLKYHLFCCESHKNVIETALGLSCKELIDRRDSYAKKLLDKYFQN